MEAFKCDVCGNYQKGKSKIIRHRISDDPTIDSICDTTYKVDLCKKCQIELPQKYFSLDQESVKMLKEKCVCNYIGFELGDDGEYFCMSCEAMYIEKKENKMYQDNYHKFCVTCDNEKTDEIKSLQSKFRHILLLIIDNVVIKGRYSSIPQNSHCDLPDPIKNFPDTTKNKDMLIEKINRLFK